MKKVTLIVGIIIGMLVLASCTDNTLEEVENIKLVKEKLIDPDDDGTADPDNEETGT